MLNVAIKAARSAGALINRASMDLDLLKVNNRHLKQLIKGIFYLDWLNKTLVNR